MGRLLETLVFYEVLGGVRVWRAGRGAGLGGSRGLSWGSWGPLGPWGPLGGGVWELLGSLGASGGLWVARRVPQTRPQRRLWGVSGGLWGPLGASGGRWGPLGAAGGTTATRGHQEGQNKQTNKQTTNKGIHKQTSKQTNKQTHKQTNKQAQRSHSTPNLTRFPFPALPGL